MDDTCYKYELHFYIKCQFVVFYGSNEGELINFADSCIIFKYIWSLFNG